MLVTGVVTFHGFSQQDSQERNFPYPENIRNGPLVRGFECDESDAVIERGMAEYAGAEDGVFWDVASGVNTGENVRQTLLDSFGVSIPYPPVHAHLLHHW